MEKNKEFDYEEIVNDQDPYQQYQEIKSLIKENIITKNKTVFMIGKEWWNQWKSYALNEDPDANPGPIDNMPLVDISNDSKSLQIKTVLN